MPGEAPQAEHDDEYNAPRVALVAVHHVIPDEARDQAAHANDDDADDERERARVDGRERLAAKDDSCSRKAESMRRRWECVRKRTRRFRVRGEDVLREDVKYRVNDSADVARAEAGNDHRSQACLRAQRRDERRGHSP